MLLRELTENLFKDNIDENQIWGRKGKTLVRKYRCTSGVRTGRIVPTPAACHQPIDIAKRAQFKRTRARLATRMARKAKKTKRTNPASIRLNKGLNKR